MDSVKSSWNSILVVIAVLLLLPAEAGAQEREWNGGFYLGYGASTDPGSPDGGLGGFANVFAMITEAFGAGVELGYWRLGEADRTYTSSDSMEVAGKINFSTWQTTAAVVGQYPGKKLRPYVIGGGGFYGIRTDEEAEGFSRSDTRSKFGMNLGIGLKFLPTERAWGLGLEGRWHLIFDGLPQEGGDLNMVTVALGLNYN
jgi:opacity protein-like surface antigen